MEFHAVVLAAGRGSRMTDLTAKTPKALLPVANRPMIWYSIQMLENAGFEEAIVIVLDSQQADIQKALIDICGVKIHLEFVPIPAGEDMGTADSLRRIVPKLKDSSEILVVSCDLVTSLPLHCLADVHRTYDATLTMLLAQAPDTTEMAAPGGKASKKIERDIIGLSGNRVAFMASEADFEESVPFKKTFFKRYPNINVKTQLLDAHLYLMKRWVLDLLVQDKSLNTVKGELVPYLVKKQLGQPSTVVQKDSATHPDASIYSDDTRPDIYSLAMEDDMMKQAQNMSTWSNQELAVSPHQNKIRCFAHVMEDGVCLRANTLLTYCEANRQVPRQLSVLAPGLESPMMHPNASIAPKSQLGSDSMAGEGSTIGEKVNIKHSVIGKHCSIGERSKITNSIIMNHVTIKEGVTLNGCVICDNAHIEEKCELKDCLVAASQKVIAMGKFTNEIIIDVNQMMTF